ncbi:hypothetical protein MINT15_23670 [Saccharomonospora viridis]|uniref:Uncharacterized protein n=1 Tax=Saccharomonospora viridis TaxID=1852 RepID=A0A837D891_9PSEU|nr:hypothetical protein MINT15_23670 [Saccharomonospora viridis]
MAVSTRPKGRPGAAVGGVGGAIDMDSTVPLQLDDDRADRRKCTDAR